MPLTLMREIIHKKVHMTPSEVVISDFTWFIRDFIEMLQIDLTIGFKINNMAYLGNIRYMLTCVHHHPYIKLWWFGYHIGQLRQRVFKKTD